MEQLLNFSDAEYQTRLERYQQSLDTLESKDKPSTAEVLEVLLARDAIQAVPPQHRPPAPTLITLQELDQRLEAKNCQAKITAQASELLPWQKRLHIAPDAWWWPSPQKPRQSWLAQQNWLWSMGSIIFLSASASLVLNTAARFWDGGIASAGTLPIVTQSVLTLIAGKGALTESGRQVWQRFLKNRGVSEAYWHEWSCVASGVVFLGVAASHASLPSIGTWYNNWGWNHYQSRRLDSALSDYKTAVSLRPDYPEAQFHAGLVYEDLQQYDQAKENYQVVVASDPDDVPLGVWLEAHNNLARLYLLEDNNRDAAPLLIRAKGRVDADLADTDPIIADVNYNLLKNLGWVRLNQQRYDEAETELKAAIDFDQRILQNSPVKDLLVEMSLQREQSTGRAAAYCLLAQLADAQERAEEASQWWQQCLDKVNRGNPDEDAWVGVYERRELEAEQSEDKESADE